MASDDLNLGKDMPDDNEVVTEKKGGMRNIIIAVVASLAIGGGAAFFLLGGDDAPPEVAAEGAEAEEAEMEPDDDLEPIYRPLGERFVVNFDDGGKLRYVQMSLQIMSYQQDVIDKVELNMPAVRNSLIMLFGSQDFQELRTIEGKEKLRKEVQNHINKVVRLKGNQKVNDVYFTAFVMQ